MAWDETAECVMQQGDEHEAARVFSRKREEQETAWNEASAQRRWLRLVDQSELQMQSSWHKRTYWSGMSSRHAGQ